jgi:gluconolactonase
MRIERDQGLSDLIGSTEEERLCTGFEFTEGPIWIPTDDCLLFSDIPGNRMHRWRPGTSEAELYLEPSGHSNGLTLDQDGNLLACEHSGRRVSLAPYAREGSAEPGDSLMASFEGRILNSPNDLVVHSSGAVYFTDPTYGLPRPGARRIMGDPNATQELPFQGVYVIHDIIGGPRLLNDEFTQPNGLAFTPDESALYVGDSQASLIRRFEVHQDGTLGEGELFVDMSGIDAPGAPDGMKVDEDGRLWTTGAGGVWVIAADGTVLGVFEMEEHAANLAFGGDEYSTLFLTAGTSVYRVETNVRGIAPGSRVSGG